MDPQKVAQMWTAIDQALMLAVVCLSLSSAHESQARYHVRDIFINCLGRNTEMWDYLVKGDGRATQVTIGMEVEKLRPALADATFPRSLQRIPGALRGLSPAEIEREEAVAAGHPCAMPVPAPALGAAIPAGDIGDEDPPPGKVNPLLHP
jgi:hypothetical protein